MKKSGSLYVELANTRGVGTPWPQGVDIGCTELPPDPLAPMCETSRMLFKNKGSTGGKGEEVPIGRNYDYKTIIRNKEKEGKIFVGYDNAGCFSKYISEACYN